MRANFIKQLCENEIKTTEIALATSSISSDLQSMIEKLSNVKVKDVAELSKKIKYDGDIDAGEQFSQNIGAKLDQAIQALTEIKSEIDNEVVKISQGESLGGAESMDMDADLGGSDIAADFGEEEDFEEFSAEEPTDDLGLDELERESK